MTDDSNRECGGEVNQSSSMSNPDPSRAALDAIWDIVHTPTKATSHRAAQSHFQADFDSIRKIIKDSRDHLPPTLNSGAVSLIEIQSVLDGARIALNNRDQSSYERLVLDSIKSVLGRLALLRAVEGVPVREALIGLNAAVDDYWNRGAKTDSAVKNICYWQFKAKEALSHPNTGDGYDPAFVEEIKRTDELPPEALFDNGPDMLAWLNHPSDGGVAGDDDCEDQACPPTDRCTKFKCDNAELVLRGKYWRCPNCGASYGEYPFHGGVAGEPVAREAMERCAKIAEQVAINAERRAAGHTDREARDAAYNKMEGARDVAHQIRERAALPPVPGNEGREAIIEKCAGIVDRWIGDITKAGDQFDKGGDIYSHANVLQGVAASIRGLSHSRSYLSRPSSVPGDDDAR